MMMPRSQSVSGSMAEGRTRGAGAAVERDADLRSLLFVRGVRLPEPPAEVGFQVVRYPAPRLQELLVGVDPIADVGLVRSEERLERQCGEITRLAVVGAAERVHVVAPVVVDDR